MERIYTAAELRRYKTKHQGHCCDLKIETKTRRVWLCRVEGGVTIEKYYPKEGRWLTVDGGCFAESAGY